MPLDAIASVRMEGGGSTRSAPSQPFLRHGEIKLSDCRVVQTFGDRAEHDLIVRVVQYIRLPRRGVASFFSSVV